MSHRALLGVFFATVAVGCSPADGAATSAEPIVGGFETAPDAWSSSAAIYVNDHAICVGALIAESWVITAGHCVNAYYGDGGIQKIVVGRHDLTQFDGEEHRVDHAYRHEGFNWQSLANDIGLVHLAEPSRVTPAKLVTAEQLAQVVDGAAVTVVGWGATSEGAAPSNVLRQVTVPVLPHDQCTTYPHYAGITNDVLCAGFVNGGFDACQGDSGAPLFLTINGVPAQVGITSWGIGCARPNRPGVYTRIGSYLDWITSTMAQPPPPPPSSSRR